MNFKLFFIETVPPYQACSFIRFMINGVKKLSKDEIKKLKKPYNYAALGDIKKLSKYIEKHQFDVNTPDPNNQSLFCFIIYLFAI